MFKNLGKAGGGVLLAIGSLVTLILIVGLIMLSTAYFRGTVESNERIKGDGDFRIAAYEEFFNLCQSAQTHQQTLEQNQNLLDSASSEEDKQTYQQNVAASQVQLNSTVNEYNAKAASDFTRGQFRDSDLPYKLNAEEEITCA